jgi:hypothetical protein
MRHAYTIQHLKKNIEFWKSDGSVCNSRRVRAIIHEYEESIRVLEADQKRSPRAATQEGEVSCNLMADRYATGTDSGTMRSAKTSRG